MSRYLGQHFLKNKIKLRKIAAALDIKNDETIIEIGPGHGELTEELLTFSCKVLGIKKIRIITIEKDANLVQFLRGKFKDDKNIEIIHGDALKLLPQLINNSQLITNNYKIVGNIPYYITGYLLRILGELKNKSSLIVLLIQKEVAERICAGAGSMNILAASVQFWAEPKIINYVSKKDFSPAPKVDSAIIKLTTRVQLLATNEETEKYYKFIKILFKQPRKTILNNLISNFQFLISKQEIIEKLKEIGINPQARPQDLSMEKITQLLKAFLVIHR